MQILNKNLQFRFLIPSKLEFQIRNFSRRHLEIFKLVAKVNFLQAIVLLKTVFAVDVDIVVVVVVATIVIVVVVNVAAIIAVVFKLEFAKKILLAVMQNLFSSN